MRRSASYETSDATARGTMCQAEKTSRLCHAGQFRSGERPLQGVVAERRRHPEQPPHSAIHGFREQLAQTRIRGFYRLVGARALQIEKCLRELPHEAHHLVFFGRVLEGLLQSIVIHEIEQVRRRLPVFDDISLFHRVGNALRTQKCANIDGMERGVGRRRIQKHSATQVRRREAFRPRHHPAQTLLERCFRLSQSRQPVGRHHGGQSSAILRQYLLAAGRIAVFQKTQQCEEVTVVIVIGLMMETQTAIRRGREQKNAGTLPRLRIKQVARKVSRVRVFVRGDA